jgi:hypothetical protein
MQKGLRMTESFPVKHHTENEIINKNKRDKRQNEANASPSKNKCIQLCAYVTYTLCCRRKLVVT